MSDSRKRGNMKVPFVSFLPIEQELNQGLREAFERVFNRSWYIDGVEDKNFDYIEQFDKAKTRIL